MGAGVSGFVFTAAAVAAAIFMAARLEKGLLFRIAALWVAVSFIAFLSPNKLAGFALIGVVLIALAPRNNAERVYLFVASLPVLPIHYFATVPFPGLQQLLTLDYARLSAIVLLGPVFMTALFATPRKELRSVDTCLLLFVLLTGLASIRDVTFTNMMRITVYQFLMIFVPYVAITRSINTVKELDTLLKAFFFGAIAVAFIGIISTVQSWNYYAQLADFIQYKVYTDTRNGFLRINATLIGTLLGFVMGAGAVCALYCRWDKSLPLLKLAAALLIFAAVTFVTGARGAWLVALTTVGFYIFMVRAGRMLRRLALMGMAASVTIVFVLIFNESDVIQDQYGTFAYRAELLRTSMGQIAARPFFGETGLESSPRFAHLIQGEGIVDFVNAYLQVVLFYGLVGFAFFICAHFFALRRCLTIIASFDEVQKIKKAEEPALRRIAIVIVSMHLGYLGMIMTISAVSYIWHYGYVLVAMMVATARVAAGARVTDESVGEAAPEVGADAPALPGDLSATQQQVDDRRKPYGARFVR